MNIIKSEYNKGLNTIVATFPDYIRIDDLNAWKSALIDILAKFENQTALLIDTNLHKFESIQCIKSLRELFDDPVIKDKVEKTAFVSPKGYRKAEVVSEKEAYFERLHEAYKWLQSSSI